MCPSGTGALVCVDEVNARASVLTGLRLTLVDLLGAVHTVVAGETLAKKENRIVIRG